MYFLLSIIFDTSGFYGTCSMILWEYRAHIEGGKTSDLFRGSNWAKNFLENLQSGADADIYMAK